MLLHDLAADGQSNSVAGIFAARVQTLEDDENILQVFRGHADAIVGDGYRARRLIEAHADFGRHEAAAQLC